MFKTLVLRCLMNPRPVSFFLALIILFVGGCSSLMVNQDRDTYLAAFLGRPERYALFTPASVKSEEKLKLFGLEDSGRRFSQQFHLESPIMGVMKKFLDGTPDMAGIRIVNSEQIGDMPTDLEEPVLFFHSDWRLVYRRLPPDFHMNQLQVGVIAKIIPLGQVLSGHGSLALRTAAWEGSCYYKVFDGEFFHLDDWASADGDRLRRGIESAQTYCGEKLSTEFKEELISRGFLSAP